MNFLKYKKNTRFYIDNLPIDSLAKKFTTPFYCYSLSQIKYNLKQFSEKFKKINPLICFSVKSNSNISILNELKKRGCGADVVSIGELIASLKAGIEPKKIVFSGVGKTEKELEFAIKKNILLINIESESESILINKISKKLSKITRVGIRLNPNINSGTLKKISTGTINDKFGLLEANFLDLCNKSKNFKNISLECLSVHIGSQIQKIEPFKKLIYAIDKILKKVSCKFKYVDLGGGIGIPYQSKDNKINLSAYSKLVSKFKTKNNCKIIFEPGRIILGNAGILVTRITYIKKTTKKYFVIMDAGMNDFIRPALYDTKHIILPVKKSKIIKKNIEFVGPICESADKFLNTKKFSVLKERDVLVICDVGAYGMSLASNYNLRPRAMEILINKSKFKVIRKRENLMNLIHK